MRLLRNRGNARALDVLRTASRDDGRVDIASADLSLFGVEALRAAIGRGGSVRFILPGLDRVASGLPGGPSDRADRNQLSLRHLSEGAAAWFRRAAVRSAPQSLPQSALIAHGGPALVGACDVTNAGLGLRPTNLFGIVQMAETDDERAMLSAWFEDQWQALGSKADGRDDFVAAFANLGRRRSAADIYLRVLDAVFSAGGEGLEEERIVRSATGIRDTAVWSKLYRFQRDGVVGAIDKLQRYGGCIIADSVGLGKTFEALAIIKYHELRNDRVLVLCPKRLRDNWTLPKANDRRNVLAADRFNYDVLNHTDLSREDGHWSDPREVIHPH